MDIIDNISNPQRSRLFPVLADTSKEGRTLSIFLTTLASVRNFSHNILGAVGQRIGVNAKIKTYTEVTFKSGVNPTLGRPDGLIVLKVGKREWTALIEAKVGKEQVETEQLERYLDIAKQEKIDAVITITNQFSTVPDHHPVKINYKKYSKIGLYHFSWMHIMTVANLLTVNKDVDDDDQAFILKEFLRFISHPSAGVVGFTQMPPRWTEAVKLLQAGGRLATGDMVNEIVYAWQQETKDLCLILSRQLGTFVSEKLSRSALSDIKKRYEVDCKSLIDNQKLEVSFNIPDAASPLKVDVDFRSRTILNSMYLRAPDDKVSNKARLNWLLRQIPDNMLDEVHIRINWPGTSPINQFLASTIQDNPDCVQEGKGKMVLLGYDIIIPNDLGARFGQRKTIIQELEQRVPHYYESIGQHLRAWQSPAPKLSQDKVKPETVTPSEIAASLEPDGD